MCRVNFLRLLQCSGKIKIQTNKCSRFYCNQPKNKLRNVLKLSERGMYNDIFPDTSV